MAEKVFFNLFLPNAVDYIEYHAYQYKKNAQTDSDAKHKDRIFVPVHRQYGERQHVFKTEYGVIECPKNHRRDAYAVKYATKRHLP